MKNDKNEFDYDAAFSKLNFLEQQVMIAASIPGEQDSTLEEICHVLFVEGEETDAINNVLVELMKKEQLECISERYYHINPENWDRSPGYREYLSSKKLKPVIKALTQNKVLAHFSGAITQAMIREFRILKKYGVFDGNPIPFITSALVPLIQNLSIQIKDYKDED